MEKIQLSHSSGSRVEVYLFGATITSFIDSSGREILFVSENAVFDGKKSIRGGIPLVFPIFGPGIGQIPNHGFVRTALWSLGEKVETEAECSLTLLFENNESTMSMWPHEFKLEFQILLEKDRLITTLKVENQSTNQEKEFSFQALQHTYYKATQTINQIRVHGLQNVAYIDKLQPETFNSPLVESSSNGKEISSETDSIYIDAPNELTLDMGNGSSISIKKKAFRVPKNSKNKEELKSDVVVWNPWIDKAAGMSDFGNDEYKTMICVEPGKVSTYEKLNERGDAWYLQQIIHVNH